MHNLSWESKTLSRNGQVTLIIAITAAIATCTSLAIFLGGVYVVVAVVVCLPLALVLMSLVFGSVARGQGLFSWKLLYLVGAVSFMFIVLADKRPSGHVFWFPTAVIALAEHRRRAARRWSL